MTAAGPPPADLVFRGRCVLPDGVRQATVSVLDGRIASVSVDGSPTQAGSVAETADPANVVELAHDEVLIPGLVDTHVHVNEPGRTEWEGFASATRAAAAGGVTAIVDMPLNSIPPTVDVAALAVKRAATKNQRYVDVGFWGGAVPSSLGNLEPVHAQGVYGFKCFLADSGIEEFPPLDHRQLEQAMREVAELDSLLLVHAEDARVLAAAPACTGPSYADFVRSRPSAAEDRAIAEVLDLAAAYGSRVHILHLSDAGSLPRLSDAKAGGVRVSVETCPHYLTLAAEEIADGQTQFKCCPPIRDAANRDRLWQGLTDGIIDMVVSDHSPCTAALKQLDSGDFGRAWGGVSSIQLGLPLVWTEARARGYGLGDVVRWMATRPAEVVGVPGKGALTSGYDADLVVLASEETFVVEPERLHHKNPVSPYADRRLQGVVHQTWLRGQQVARYDTVSDIPLGHLLTRGGPDV